MDETFAYQPPNRLTLVVGNYGSGKTEVAVNLAIRLAADQPVTIVDLDLVNPYFRSREAQRLMEAHGIRVVVPPGDQAYADLPIILPEIQGMLHPPEGWTTVFDVGGDDVGARALAAFRPALGDAPYQLWQVVNSKRPFTSTVDGCLRMQASIERASRLAVTGLLANSHLIQDTTPETVVEGWRLARDLSAETNQPVRCVAVMDDVCANGADSLEEVEAPLLRMQRYMLPPWLPGASDDADSKAPLPAARTVPIGKPEAHLHPRVDGTHARPAGAEDGDA